MRCSLARAADAQFKIAHCLAAQKARKGSYRPRTLRR